MRGRRVVVVVVVDRVRERAVVLGGLELRGERGVGGGALGLPPRDEGGRLTTFEAAAFEAASAELSSAFAVSSTLSALSRSLLRRMRSWVKSRWVVYRVMSVRSVRFERNARGLRVESLGVSAESLTSRCRS